MANIIKVIRTMQNLNEIIDSLESIGLMLEDGSVIGSDIFGSLTNLEDTVFSYLNLKTDSDTDSKTIAYLQNSGLFANKNLSDNEIETMLKNVSKAN